VSRTARLREGGFTLVELLLAIVLLGIIITPLMGGIVTGLRTIGTGTVQYTNGSDARLLQLYFAPDVQSTGNGASDVVVTPTANTECSGVTNVLRLRWSATETPGTTNTYVAAYAVQSVSGTWQLLRYFCVNSGTATVTTIAHNLSSSSAVSIQQSGTSITLTATETNGGSGTVNVAVTGTRRTT